MEIRGISPRWKPKSPQFVRMTKIRRYFCDTFTHSPLLPDAKKRVGPDAFDLLTEKGIIKDSYLLLTRLSQFLGCPFPNPDNIGPLMQSGFRLRRGENLSTLTLNNALVGRSTADVMAFESKYGDLHGKVAEALQHLKVGNIEGFNLVKRSIAFTYLLFPLDLSGLDFTGMFLNSADFSWTDLRGAKLSMGLLHHAKFRDGIDEHVQTDLSRALLDGAGFVIEGKSYVYDGDDRESPARTDIEEVPNIRTLARRKIIIELRKIGAVI